MTSADIKDYESACAYISDAASLGSRPGLSRITELCDILGNPEDDLSFIHIAGTNGKGSTLAMIASALKCAHLKVGMYYSPALCGIRDHYAINGELISAADYAHAVSIVAAANDRLISKTHESATQFELETAIAFTYFSENHCDVVVLETGMGGRDDATNIVKNKICCVLTSISMDHMQYLGDTIEEITAVKAGIITGSFPVVALDSGEQSMEVIRRACAASGSDLYPVSKTDISFSDDKDGIKVDCAAIRGLHVPLSGTFQAENAAVAATVLNVIKDKGLLPKAALNEDTIREGISSVRWPFRFEKISDAPPVYVDGAHNADAAIKLGQTFDTTLSGYDIVLVAGMFADKEYDKVIKELASRAVCVYTLCPPDNQRGLDEKILADTAKKYCRDVNACKSVKEAYDKALDAAKKRGGKAAVVAAGSLSYLSGFKDLAVRS